MVESYRWSWPYRVHLLTVSTNPDPSLHTLCAASFVEDLVNCCRDGSGWFPGWGERPRRGDHAEKTAALMLAGVPTLVPLHQNRFVASDQGFIGTPVFSVYPSDHQCLPVRPRLGCPTVHLRARGAVSGMRGIKAVLRVQSQPWPIPSRNLTVLRDRVTSWPRRVVSLVGLALLAVKRPESAL